MSIDQSKQEVGFVQNVRNFLAYLDGLPTVKINDLIETDKNKGFVHALMPNGVAVFLLDETKVKPGQLFRKAHKSLGIGVSDYLLGRAIDPLGNPVDGKGVISHASNFLPLEKKAPGINAREFISNQFVTGITLIDMLMPLGKGQRELILGDARSGKTSFLIDLIVNQKNSGVICIYASIGKAVTDVKKLIDILGTNKALGHTIIVAAASSDPPPLIFLAPKTAFSIAEYFQKKGKDVLLILDDLGNHAKIYREIALLEGKAPGRESYPGDIFYQHAHLLERAGNFKDTEGGGSITALPVIELNLTDFTSFIPTNVMAMTDGHLLFTSSLYNQGQRPAIDISLSVTRVGLQTQHRVQNAIAGRVKSVLTQAGQLEAISSFSAELPVETQLILKQKDIIREAIRQEPLTFYSREVQIIFLALIFTSFMADKDVQFIRVYRKNILNLFATDKDFMTLGSTIRVMKTDEELLTILEKLIPKIQSVC